MDQEVERRSEDKRIPGIIWFFVLREREPTPACMFGMFGWLFPYTLGIYERTGHLIGTNLITIIALGICLL
jgi:hypothetical protein